MNDLVIRCPDCDGEFNPRHLVVVDPLAGTFTLQDYLDAISGNVRALAAQVREQENLIAELEDER